MEPRNESDDLLRLAIALADMRDSLVNLSLALQDLDENTPSTQRDELMLQVERHLARIKEGERR